MDVPVQPPEAPPVVQTRHVLRLPWLFPYQRELVANPARELVVVSATQIGKSVACAAWQIARAWSQPGSLNWWCAPTYKQTLPGYRLMKQMLMAAGCLVPGPSGYSDGELILRLNNGGETRLGAIIECRSWERDENLQGPSVHNLVVDEAGLLTSSARAIISSRRSATLGPVRYIGNPGVTGSEFWLLCEQAKEGEVDPQQPGWWRFMRWPWTVRYEGLLAIDPARAAAYKRFIKSEEKAHGPEAFKRWYGADWATPEGAIFASVLDRIAVLPFDPNPHPGHPYTVGWDIGLQSDYSVGLPLCTVCFTITDMKRLRPGSSALLKQEIKEYCHHWNDAEAVIERNGPGDPILDELTGIYPKASGWWTDNSNKRSSVFEIIRRAGETEADGITPRPGLTIAPFPAMMNEIRVFQSQQSPTTQTWSFSAPKGAKDDCVMSLIITVGAATSGASMYLRMMERQIADMKAGKTPPEGPPVAPSN